MHKMTYYNIKFVELYIHVDTGTMGVYDQF